MRRWITLLLIACTLVGCGGVITSRTMPTSTRSAVSNTTSVMVPWGGELVYQPTYPAFESVIPMTYTVHVDLDPPPTIMIQQQMNGIVTTTLPLSIMVAADTPIVDTTVPVTYTLPLNFTLTTKGVGTIQVVYELFPGVLVERRVFVLATDEGVFLDSLSRGGVYSVYLSELEERGIIDATTTEQRFDQLINDRTLTVPINGTPTTVDFSLPDYERIYNQP